MTSCDPSLRSGLITNRALSKLCAFAITAAGALALAINATSSDTVITSGFERAFAALGQPAKTLPAKPYDGIAGTEDFWLRAPAGDQIVKAMAIGQEITLSGRGSERHLTITDVRDAGDAETHIDTTGYGARVLLITCREGDAKTGREIRLRLDAGRITEAQDLAARAL